MKTRLSLVCTFIAAPAFAQGPLTPPGAPAPTMKTLDEIHSKVADVGERRTPISSIPFTITQPGSYYLTTNLSTASSVDGISIDAKDVTIDLNGFRMTGFGTGLVAIKVTNASVNTQTLVVKNGTIDGWQTAVGGVSSALNACEIEGVNFKYGGAIQLGAARNVVVSRCVFEGCSAANGGVVVPGSAAIVADCRVSNSQGTPTDSAISASTRSIVRDCVVDIASTWGIRVSDQGQIHRCTVSGAGGFAISPGQTAIVEDCSVSGAFSNGVSTASYGRIRGCAVNLTTSGATGISASSSGSLVSDCTVSVPTTGGATGVRVDFGRVERVVVTGAANGIALLDSVAADCKVDATSIGIQCLGGNSSSITGCEVVPHGGTGISLSARCVALKNVIRNTIVGGVGISADSGSENVIDENRINGCTTGVSVTTASNTITRNVLRANTTALSIAGGNDVGPATSAAAATSPAGNIVN